MPQQDSVERINIHDSTEINQVADAFRNSLERIGCHNPFPEAVRIANYPSEDWLSEVQRRTPSSTGRPLEDVLREADEIFSYRISTKHPRFFAFIPSPVSPMSWLGDSLSSAHNTYAGSSESGSGVCAVEKSLIAWIAERFGLPSSAGGQFVSGASMATLTAVAVARDQRLEAELRHRATVYILDESHFCITKALRVVGILDSQIRTIRCDSKYRMDSDHLRRAISEDLADGFRPFLVVATCGTTSTGGIDPLNEIADIADEHGLWMHVDAAYGGSVAFSSTHRPLVDGLGRADSIAWDPHKWLFQTYGCGTILFREKSHPLKSFASTAHFCRDFEDEMEPQNPWNYGIELTRPARHMRLWFSLQVLGMNTIDKMIGRGFELSVLAEGEIKRLADWVILAPTSLAIVNFRFAPHGVDEKLLDQINTHVSNELAAENIACILTTLLDGVVGLRMCTINPRTTDDDIRRVVRALGSSAQGAYRELFKARD